MRDPFLAPVGRFSNAGLVLARLIICSLFIWSGFHKIQSWDWVTHFLSSHGFPFTAFWVVLAVVVEFASGVMLLLGFYTRVAAGMLLALMVPATILFHQFWQFEGMYAVLQQELFMSNLALVGGLLLLAVAGPGKYSWDARHAVWFETEEGGL